MMTDTEYQTNRRTATHRDIEEAQGSSAKLMRLLSDRKSLAHTYALDGAHRTASLIRVIDVPLIEDALRTLTTRMAGSR